MTKPIIPNFMQMKMVDENGHATPEFHNYQTLLNQALQNMLSNEGIKTPQQTADNITALNTTKSTSALLYDSDNHELKVNINGTFKTVQVV